MTIIQDTRSNVDNFRNSSVYSIISTAWSLALLLLGITFLGSRDHALVLFLAANGIPFTPTVAITFMGFGVSLWRLFGSALLPNRWVFFGCTFVPLIPYAVINVLLVTRGEAQADRVPLMIILIFGVILSWHFAEEDERKRTLIQNLYNQIHSLESAQKEGA